VAASPSPSERCPAPWGQEQTLGFGPETLSKAAAWVAVVLPDSPF
jgi:hypothetical protein